MNKDYITRCFRQAFEFALEFKDANTYAEWVKMSLETDKIDDELTRQLVLGVMQALYDEHKAA